ncbi:hypothetical protein E2C01_060948 [Portunus trituberculatus]|uniref:Uncharacterized protein n=1 Tax=Portunus trituberculatus TaxID=210409 RepID=A0A5B7HB03_PORTR|nr:hypothetical protein [Portunus trituberculatus]
MEGRKGERGRESERGGEGRAGTGPGGGTQYFSTAVTLHGEIETKYPDNQQNHLYLNPKRDQDRKTEVQSNYTGDTLVTLNLRPASAVTPLSPAAAECVPGAVE